MEIDLSTLLGAHSALALFVVLALGYLLGKISVRGLSLGATAGVLLVGLVFGHWEFKAVPAVQELGFILFMYSIGFQAGPRFFSVFAKDGKRYIMVAGCVALSAALLVTTIHGLLDLAPGQQAGMMAGALTSTPTLAAARDAVTPAFAAARDLPRESIVQHILVSYALTYIFGLTGLILMVRWLPKVFRIDLRTEAAKLSKEIPADEGSESGEAIVVASRTYRVTQDDFTGRALKDLEFRQQTGCLIDRIRHDGESMEVRPETKLRADDVVALVGPPAALRRTGERLGPEVQDEELLSLQFSSASIIVANKDAIGKPLSALPIDNRGGCFLTRVTRAHIPLPVTSHLVLEAGDILHVTGPKARLKMLTQKLGYVEREVYQTDMLVLAFGIALGLLIGQVTFRVGDLNLGLGTAGGLLLSGVLIGFLRSYNPTFGSMPQATRWAFMELGMQLFMANVGLSAGAGIVAAFLSVGPQMMLCGAMVMVLPALVGFLFGHYVLKLNPALLMGAVTGSMTSTPALNIVCKSADSNLPALGYAGAYTFANVFLTVAGTLIMRL